MDPKMIEAVQTGNITALYELIERDPYVLEHIDQIPFIHTPLHFAACTEREHLSFVQEIINLKPSFARKLNQAGFSPMHLALQNSRFSIVPRLLKFDKDLVRLKGKEGTTPLHLAVQMGNIDILIEFLEVCPEAIEDVNVRGETAFHVALKQNKLDAFEVLVGWLRRSRHKAAQRWEKELLTSGDFEGNTVLHTAVIQKKLQEVKLLLDNFSHEQINVKNLEGWTALDIALSKHRKATDDLINRQIYDMLSNATLIRSLDRKMAASSVGRLIASFYGGNPKSSTKIDSLKSKMSCYRKFKTAIARRRSDISEQMRNTFLVVTVLMITAAYSAPLNPPKKENGHGEDGSLGELRVNMIDIYSLFWMYNTQTFWVSVGLTAVLLPSRSFCLFILITLSLFGSCYTLLNLASVDKPNHWYYSVMVMNSIFSTLLALLVAYRIARYVCLKLTKTRRVFHFLILLISFLFIAIFVLFPAAMLTQIIWKMYFNLQYA